MPLSLPTEPQGYVHMAAAFEKFGAERYREEWTGTERVASPPLKVLPEIHLATNDDRDNAFSHLSWARPDIAAGMIVHPSWLESVLGGNTRRLPFSDEGWAIAMEASRGLFKSQEPHFVRGDAVRQEMAALCYNGEMEAFARPVSGGGMTPIPTDAWNTECLFGRFHDCKISLRDPFGAARQAADSWIFVTQASLDMVCARDAKAARERRPYYSPYIRCMHATAKKLGITRRKQPKKASVELDLEKQFDAAGLKDYGAHLVQAAATLLRDPDSQLGRGKKSQK